MRSGTHLAIDTLRTNFDCFSTWKLPLENNSYLYADLDVYMKPVQRCQIAGLRSRLTRPARPISKCHWALSHWNRVSACHPQLSRWIGSCGKILMVVRDPRKIILSNLAWNASNDKDFSLDAVPGLAVSLVAQLDRHWPDILSSTVAPVDVLDTSLLLKQTGSSISDVATFLDAQQSASPALPDPLRGLWASRLQRLVGVRPDSSAILTRRRPSEFSWILRLPEVEDAINELLQKTGQFPFLAAHQ